MKIDVIEDEKDKLVIEVHDNLTLVNLINENLWNEKIDYAAYSQDHPYLSKPRIVIKSKDPKKALISAAEQVIDDVKELRKQAENALK